MPVKAIPFDKLEYQWNRLQSYEQVRPIATALVVVILSYLLYNVRIPLLTQRATVEPE
jgi:hypothetical protein